MASAGRFLLTGHEHPDGDCLGSQVAFAQLLRALGKEAFILNPDPVARSLDFIGERSSIASFSDAPLPEHDVVVLLDCNQISRLGRMAGAVRGAGSTVAVVDHHVAESGGGGDIFYVDTGASATGVLVHRLFRHFDQPLDPIAAEGIFLSIVSDTGWFRYSNTNAEVMAIASEVVEAGVDACRIYDLIHRRNDAESVELLSACLAQGQVLEEGRVAVIQLPRELVERANRIGFDLDQVMDPYRSIAGIEVVAMLKGRQDREVKLSLRATHDVDVQRIAKTFGGGGHKKAAGATIAHSLDESAAMVIERVREAVAAVEG